MNQRQEEIDQDRKDLQRGVLVNYAGYPLKAAHPVLMVFLVRAYGAEAFGLFVAAQSVLLLLTKVCTLGLDKAMLWWIPQRDDHEQLLGTRASCVSATALALALTVVCLAAAGPIANLVETPGATPALRVMSIALVPMTLLELVLGMTMGMRRMGANVVVRETILPLSLVTTGLLLWPLGWGTTALSVAMVVSYSISLVAALWSARRLFGQARDPHTGLRIPKAIWAYAWPMWFAEMANTFLLRLDMWAIAALSDLRMVGIYGVVVQFGNTIRSIRRAYDPIVLAISARIGTDHDPQRLAAGYSYATAMVVGTQLPVLVFFIVFAADLLALYGRGFVEGTRAVMILSGFWVITSGMSLSGIVVNAYGHSRLALYNVLGASAVQLVLLWLLVPRFALDGAAGAVGATYTVLSLAQLIQMRVITGGFHYRRDTLKTLVIGAITTAPLALGFALLPGTDLLWVRIALFALFAIVYLALFWPLIRQRTTSSNILA